MMVRLHKNATTTPATRPIFSTSDFVQMAGIPAPTARRFLGVLKKHKIIKELMESTTRRLVDHFVIKNDQQTP